MAERNRVKPIDGAKEKEEKDKLFKKRLGGATAFLNAIGNAAAGGGQLNKTVRPRR